MTSFPTRTDSQEMNTQGVCLYWTKGGMLKLDYFPEVENMVELMDAHPMQDVGVHQHSVAGVYWVNQ
jgi:hypothetical protein